MKIIHIAKLDRDKIITLQELTPGLFDWFDQDKSLNLSSSSIEEAFKKGRKELKARGFSPIHCGYKFTLPERDEHGKEALYIDMMKSLASPNGIFFDETMGHNAVVHQIPSYVRNLKIS